MPDNVIQFPNMAEFEPEPEQEQDPIVIRVQLPPMEPTPAPNGGTIAIVCLVCFMASFAFVSALL